MKKLLPIIVLLVLAAAAWYFSASRQTENTLNTTSLATDSVKNGEDSTSSSATTGLPPPLRNNGEAINPGTKGEGDEMEGTEDAEVQPAAKVYKSADEALAAVKRAAADYDDSILEQFTEPGEDCTWCPEFYKGVRDLLSASDTPKDQISYYGELLAVSGNLENVQALVDGISQATNQETKDALAEALELAVGKDQVVGYLGDQLSSPNDQVRESSVAALTNSGSRMAMEILYQHTVQHGDPDGYYSMGIGLGETVPEPEALPYLQDMMNKHDKYSHLAVKALLNSGLDGLRLVMDSLESSKDNEFDKQMLQDAADHVNFEDEIEEYLKKTVGESKNPVKVEFANKLLNAFKTEESAIATPEN